MCGFFPKLYGFFKYTDFFCRYGFLPKIYGFLKYTDFFPDTDFFCRYGFLPKIYGFLKYTDFFPDTDFFLHIRILYGFRQNYTDLYGFFIRIFFENYTDYTDFFHFENWSPWQLAESEAEYHWSTLK